jgi:hypothetical protein
MRIASLSCVAILAIGCNSSVASGGAGGGSTGATTGASSSTGGDTCPAPPSPKGFEAGSGELCFQRLTPGQTVTVLQGPQGGYHLWLGVSCVGCDAKTIVEFGVKDPATMTWFVGTAPQKVSVDLGGTGWQQQAGFTAFLPGTVWDPKSPLPKGAHVLLTAIREDAGGAAIVEINNDVVLGDVEQYTPPCDPDPMTCGLPGGVACCSLSG